MRVLILSWEFPPRMVGGLGRHVSELSKHLSTYGVEPHILTPRVVGSPLFENIDGAYIYRIGNPINNGHFKSWAFSFNGDLIREALRLDCLSGGFKVIHVHDWLVAYAGRSLAKILKIPLVSTIHATEFGRNLGLHNRMQKEIHEIEHNLVLDSDRVICCSGYMQEEIETLFNIHYEKIIVIPNGASSGNSEDKIIYRTPGLTGIDEDDRILFFIGRLVPEKGVVTLIKALGRIADVFPEVKLVIGGKGPQEDELKGLVREIGLDNRVFFTGFVSDQMRDELYHWAEVAVFPSTYEPFGIVALEAMVAGTPVIVSDVGGLGEIVEDGVNGLKIPPFDDQALATALTRLLTDSSLAAAIRNNAYQALEDRYSWDRIAAQTCDVYQAVLPKIQERGIG